MSNFTPTPRKKNGADNSKIGLSAPSSQQGKRAKLTWQFNNNNPRLVVYTGDESDQSKENGFGKIVAKLDPFIFSTIMSVLKAAVNHNGPDEYKVKIDTKDFIFFGPGKRSERPEVTASIIVKKGSDGVIGICVVDARRPNRPKIPFMITPPSFLELVNATTGQPLSAGEGSKLATEAYVEMMQALMFNLMDSQYVEPPPRDNNGRQGGGGYNRGGGGGYNGGGNGGGQSSGNGGGASYDEEIPF